MGHYSECTSHHNFSRVMLSSSIFLLLSLVCDYELPPASCTRSKRPVPCCHVSLPERRRQRTKRRRRHYYVTPRHLAPLYGSDFWRFMPHVVKQDIVMWTIVAKQRDRMRAVCEEINSLPICPRFGFVILTERQLGRR